MKKLFILPVIAISLMFMVALSGCMQQAAGQDRETMYQVSTFNALSQGVYDGSQTFGTLKAHGDTGLGTLNALDGELIVIDGKPYQVRSDGSVVAVSDSATTPFAVVTYFDPDLACRTTNLSSLSQYMASLNDSMINKNAMYVIEAQGHFNHIKVRSVPAQLKPYPVLTEAVKNQTVFDLDNINGTIVGVWFPDYMAGVNVAGYHFHFISDDRSKGGHLLDCSAEDLTSRIDLTGNFTMVLPQSGEFASADIGKTNETAVGVIER
jgi:acetolactate decarboxylase